MGSPKQILRFEGQSLLRRTTLAALGAQCRPVIAVTGAHVEMVRRELDGLDVREAFNARWESGMASSIRTGIEALLRIDPATAAVILTVCDQPHVTAGVLAALADIYRRTDAPLVASSYGGSVGVPALFSRQLFRDLACIDGGGGAKQVIAAHAADARYLSFDCGAIDIDTPEDFARVTASAESVTGGGG